jgi:hypothetical protein
MLRPSKDEEQVENAIQRRLVETMVSGGVRPFHPIRPVRKANPGGTGLFLVKPARPRENPRTPNPMDQGEAARMARLRAHAERYAHPEKGPVRVMPAQLRENEAGQERLLGLMAALGPLLWFGHAALVWLKLV